MIVVCDTNIYRSLSSDVFDIWKEKENQKGIKVKLYTVVAAELISHLDPDDSENVICFNGLKKMNKHCNCPSNKWMPLPEVLISQQYFNKETNVRTGFQNNIDALISHIDEYDDVVQFASEYVDTINDIKSYLHDIENAFVTGMKVCKNAYRLSHLDNGENNNQVTFDEDAQKEFGKLIVKAQLLEVAECIGFEEKIVTCKMVEQYVNEHKPQLKMWCDLLKKVIESGANPQNKANHVWDFRFLFLCGSRYEDEKVVLISGDGDVVKSTCIAGDIYESDCYQKCLLNIWDI